MISQVCMTCLQWFKVDVIEWSEAPVLKAGESAHSGQCYLFGSISARNLWGMYLTTVFCADAG